MGSCLTRSSESASLQIVIDFTHAFVPCLSLSGITSPIVSVCLEPPLVVGEIGLPLTPLRNGADSLPWR